MQYGEINIPAVMSSSTVLLTWCQVLLCDSTNARATCCVDHGIQDANYGGWTTVPAKHKNTLKNSPSNKRKVEDSFVDCVNSGIELQLLHLMGLPMWWMGSKDYVQSTEIHLVGGLNENSPLN